MARVLWLPMPAMGLMAVGVGLIASIVAGTHIADFFCGDPAETLRTGQAINSWAVGMVFLGLGFILSAITMTLVNIVRTLRDSGRDVQQAVGAREITQLRKLWTGRLIPHVPHVMMMRLLLVIAAFAVGVFQASLLADLPAAGLADPAQLQGQNLADFGIVQATAQWLGGLRVLGLATIFLSIILALRTITRAIAFKSQRVQELAAERAGHPTSAPAPAVARAWAR